MASSNASLAEELKKYVSQHKVFEPLTTLLNSQGAVMHLKPVLVLVIVEWGGLQW